MSSCSSSSRSSQRRWSVPGELGCRAFGQRDVPVPVARPNELELAAGLEPLGGKGPDRVEQPKPRLAGGRLLGLDQALVDERHQPVEDVAAKLRRRPADRLGGLEVTAAGEDRQSIEQPLAALVEQVVAPRDRTPQRLLASGQVTRSGSEDVELLIEPDEDGVGREDLDPGRCQLDGERHPMQPRADGRDRGSVLVGDCEARPDRDGPLDEQPDGGVLAERDGIDGVALAALVQPLHRAQLARDRAGPAGPARGTPAHPRHGGPPGS